MTANPKLADIAKLAGYCCTHSMLSANAHLRASVLAKQLGMSKRILNLWRNRFKRGALTSCPACPKVGFHKPLQRT